MATLNLAPSLLVFSLAACGGSADSGAPTGSASGSNGAGGAGGKSSSTSSAGGTSKGTGGDGGHLPPPIDAGAGVWVDITPPSVSLDMNNPPMNYGMQTLVIDPKDDGTVYVGTNYQGIWKTTDYGQHWTKASTGNNGANLETGRNWTLAIDPSAPKTLYTVAGYGEGQGIWKSTNGGVDWEQKMQPSLTSSTSADIYCITVDSTDSKHVLAAFHSPWPSGDAGIIESKNGGDTWTLRDPKPGWGAGHYVFFLGDSTTWLLGTQGDGFWRTTDSGATWTQVSTVNMQHGASEIYRTSSGVYYVGAEHTILRSTDVGRTWTSVGPSNQDGYNAIVGDGTTLYAQSANTGEATTGPKPYVVSSETDGMTWKHFNDQTFTDGPMSMAVDRVHGVVYSSNWGAGVWRLVVGK